MILCPYFSLGVFNRSKGHKVMKIPFTAGNNTIPFVQLSFKWPTRSLAVSWQPFYKYWQFYQRLLFCQSCLFVICEKSAAPKFSSRIPKLIIKCVQPHASNALPYIVCPASLHCALYCLYTTINVTVLHSYIALLLEYERLSTWTISIYSK